MEGSNRPKLINKDGFGGAFGRKPGGRGGYSKLENKKF